MIDILNYDKKTVDDSINKIFGLIDMRETGLIEKEEILLSMTFLCEGTVVSFIHRRETK